MTKLSGWSRFIINLHAEDEQFGSVLVFNTLNFLPPRSEQRLNA